MRDQILLERTTEPVHHLGDVPPPTPAAHDDQLTILDVGWAARQVVISPGWLAATVQAAATLVVVTRATVPGFRRLEVALEEVGAGTAQHLDRVVLAVVGPRRKRWPRGVEDSSGPATRHLLAASRLVEVPQDRALRVTGLDSRPLPRSVTAAATRLLALTDPVP